MCWWCSHLDGLSFIYAADFPLLLFNAHMCEGDCRILRFALVGLANHPNLEDMRTTVLSDLDAFMAQETGV